MRRLGLAPLYVDSFRASIGRRASPGRQLSIVLDGDVGRSPSRLRATKTAHEFLDFRRWSLVHRLGNPRSAEVEEENRAGLG